MTPVQLTLVAILIICIPIAIAEITKRKSTRRRLQKDCPEMKAGSLRIGDSFILELKDNARVYRITKITGASVTAYHFMRSDMKSTGKPIFLWADSTVYFIRHTIPLPGEECFVEDLKPQDVFIMPTVNHKKWFVVQKGYDFDKVAELYGDKEGRIGRLAKVVFMGNRGKTKANNN